MKKQWAKLWCSAIASVVFLAAAGCAGQSKPAGSASSTTPSPSTSSSPTPFVKGTRMRIPGKLSIVVPDGYIAYTAEQTRRSFHPIVIVPQGTPIEKADRTPQRLEILTYFTKENAEKNRDNHFNDYINWKQISELRKENVIKINNSILYGIYYKRTDETGTVSRQTWYRTVGNNGWKISIIGPNNTENIPQELLDTMRTIEFAKQKQTDSD